MSKALSCFICALICFGVVFLAARMHYIAGYTVNDLTIWALAAMAATVGALSSSISAIAAFIQGK